LSVKKSWAIRYNSEAVSPVIGTILMVSTTVVLVAILFVMVIGFGGNSFSPSVLVLDKSSVPNGYKVQLTEATADVKWGDIIIQLNEGPNTTSWTNLTTADLVSSTSPTMWHHGSPLHLDNLSVFLNITDLSGNGKIDRGDSLTFTTCSSPTFVTTLTYTLTLVYKPTGGSILSSPIF
jgi:FlaG/FlaF family flagellin (archaellin)